MKVTFFAVIVYRAAVNLELIRLSYPANVSNLDHARAVDSR